LTESQKVRLESLSRATLLQLAAATGTKARSASAAYSVLSGLDESQLADVLDAGERADAYRLEAAKPATESPEPDAGDSGPSPDGIEPVAARESPCAYIEVTAVKYRETVSYNDTSVILTGGTPVRVADPDVLAHILGYLDANSVGYRLS